MRDPYAVLGVAKTADEKEIKSAFRRLAKAHHPDANADDPQAAARFSEANQAYEILGDPAKRAQFDRGEIDAEGRPRFQAGGDPFGGGTPFARGGRRRAGGFSSAGGSGAESMFSDIFEQAFGGRNAAGGGFSAAREAASRGADLRTDLIVRLEDLARGEKVEAKFPNGKRLAIALPDGVEEGQTIRLKGQGAAGRGGAPGDALVTIRFAPHDRFRVEGRDVVADLDIPLETAVLGGKVEVATLTGRISLTIPPGTDSGRTFRLRGRGLTTRGGGRGDLRAVARIVLPKDTEALARFLRDEVRSEPAAG